MKDHNNVLVRHYPSKENAKEIALCRLSEWFKCGLWDTEVHVL